MKRPFFTKLDSWFGDKVYTVLHHWFEPSADAPTLFVIVTCDNEMIFMRVHNVSGRLQVHADRRMPIEEV